MKKIAKVIEKCSDCEHCVFVSNYDKTSHFAICYTQANPPFVLDHANDTCRNYEINIPTNCPLEDYKQ
jgi:hypothetical protein